MAVWSASPTLLSIYGRHCSIDKTGFTQPIDDTSTRRRKFSHYSNSPNSELRTPNPSQNSTVIYAAEY